MFTNATVDLGQEGVRLIRNHGPLNTEDCCMCDKDTPFWYEAGDVPLCCECARRFHPSSIPTKGQWLRRLGYDLPAGWPHHEHRVRSNPRKKKHDPVVHRLDAHP